MTTKKSDQTDPSSPDETAREETAPEETAPEETAPEQARLNPPGMEALTLEELDDFMRRAKARAANFRPEEAASLAENAAPDSPSEEVAVDLPAEAIAQLSVSFFDDAPAQVRPRPLVQGLIFDFDNTLARLTRSLDDLMDEGAQQAVAYMRSTGMDDLPDDFWESLVEARLFAQEKSDDEQEEHTAEDTLSFLLQFFGYPASRMDRDVLARAVDLFYAPEMTAWEPMPGARGLLQQLQAQQIPVAVIANYSIDRVFQRMIDYTGLRPYLDVCLSSASVEWRKPGKDIYDAVLKRWDVEPYELICVGDSLKHDIAGGHAIGALTVHCRMIPLAEDQRIVDSVQPDAVIDELSQLPALLESWR